MYYGITTILDTYYSLKKSLYYIHRFRLFLSISQYYFFYKINADMQTKTFIQSKFGRGWNLLYSTHKYVHSPATLLATPVQLLGN